MRLRDPSHVVMLGTSFQTHGGIASVLAAYRRAGLFERWPIEFVATHSDGGLLRKLGRAVAALAAFVGLLLRHRRAVLHVHSASRASFWRKSVFMALAMVARWPVIFHLHGGGFGTFYDAECGPVARAVVRFFLDHAACVVVLSERWCAWMHRVTRNPHVVAIANPVAPVPASGVEREPALVAFAGRCEAKKGVFDLLCAAAGLAYQHRALRLEIAGSGELEALRSRAHRLGIADRMHLHGWIDAAAREKLLARATVLVLPSHAEGLPMGVLEAMAAGCPVVATRVGGVPDLIEDGVSGLLVAPGDPVELALAVHRIIANPPFAARLAAAARETVARRFAPERALAPLESLYAGLGVARLPTPGDAPRDASPGCVPNLQELL